ncbi:unnamed protein product (macronuclear) [Paramecium tetraurelia]|uniref:Transmembrane protein n=1 Tax=Paramecium tetraurelia TaxID=5888 RepID=A0D9K5_PARTE|nr:uncharacterized protein GSPATT00014652001 [Paramecium tetraurelia]CAK79722.1 unnamed protein product [Paramecium tetraurelia]|eukprot:XP_001447119.1 hypothetical protein (macronuclear) [Paramecium tetraurelia strain d4-2]
MNLELIKSYFLYLDKFACPVQLFIQKKRGYQTYLGAFTTLGCVLSILFYLTNKLSQIDDRTEFQTLYSDIFHLEPPYYKLTEDNFTLQFAFQYQNKTNYINESIYIPEAYLVYKQITEVNGKKKEQSNKTLIPISKCSKNGIIQDELAEQFDDQDLSNTYCLDWSKVDSLALFGTDDSPEYQYINVSFTVCQNGSKPGIVCADSETIQKVLNRNYIHFQLTSYIINLRDFTQPQIPKVEDIYTTISAKVTKDVEIFMQPITTLTDFGYFQKELRKDTTLRYFSDKEIIDFNTDTSLANVVIRLSDTEQVSYRIYPKVQDVLAAAGGLWQIIIAVALFLQKPFSELAYSIEIINKLFNFEQDESEKQKKNPTTSDEINDQKPSRTLLPTQTEIKTTQPTGPDQKPQSKIKQVVSKRFPQGRQQTIIGNKSGGFIERLTQNEKINEARSLFTLVSSNIKMKLKEYAQYLTYRPKKKKMDQLDYSIKKYESFLDILFIIDKLQEIDKLKLILFNKAQMNLFEYLPKPTIYLDPYSPEQEELQFHSSILSPQKSFEEKAKQASVAFEELLVDFENNPLTQKLIACLDKEVVNVLISEYEERNRPSRARQQFLSISNAVVAKIKQDQQQRQFQYEQLTKQTEQKKFLDGTVQNSAIKDKSDNREGSQDSIHFKSQKEQ